MLISSSRLGNSVGSLKTPCPKWDRLMDFEDQLHNLHLEQWDNGSVAIQEWVKGQDGMIPSPMNPTAAVWDSTFGECGDCGPADYFLILIPAVLGILVVPWQKNPQNEKKPSGHSNDTMGFSDLSRVANYVILQSFLSFITWKNYGLMPEFPLKRCSWKVVSSPKSSYSRDSHHICS